MTWNRFHELAADLDFPMLVLTASSGEERAGCLVGFAAQCSIDPARFMVWISKQNHTYRVAVQSPVLNVHFPSSDQRDLAVLFGAETGDTVDKFSECRWRLGCAGPPVLSECARWFSGRVLERIDGGDHMGFMLEPLEGAVGPWTGQLGFQAVGDIDPGHGA